MMFEEIMLVAISLLLLVICGELRDINAKLKQEATA